MTTTCSRSQAHPGQGVPFRPLSVKGACARTGSEHLYSVSALTDASGAVVERYGYDAYGKRVILDGTGTTVRTASSFGNNIGFTGREFDPETGLWYFRARMYSDRLGRFVSRDPAGYVDGYALYNGYFAPGDLDPSGTATHEDNGSRVVEVADWLQQLTDWGFNQDNNTAQGWDDFRFTVIITSQTVSGSQCKCDFTVSFATSSTIYIPAANGQRTRQRRYHGGAGAGPTITAGVQAKIRAHEEGHHKLFTALAKRFADKQVSPRQCGYAEQQTSESCAQKASNLNQWMQKRWSEHEVWSGNRLHSALRPWSAYLFQSNDLNDPLNGSVQEIESVVQSIMGEHETRNVDDWNCDQTNNPPQDPQTGGGQSQGTGGSPGDSTGGNTQDGRNWAHRL